MTSDNFPVYDIDDEPPRGAYYRDIANLIKHVGAATTL